MIEYPSTDQDFDSAFKTEEDCLEYIISVRWPNGLSCPICQHDKLWRINKGMRLECAACGHRIRPLAGTIFQDTHLSLLCWMKMMWYIMSQKYGANAIGLSRVLGVALTTTWNILHKLRRAMVRAEREKLGPVVEVDESFFGGLEEGTPGRGAKKKVLIVGAVELSANNKRVGRIRLSIIPDASSSSLIAFIKKNVEPGSTVVTDGWSGYHPLKGEKFTHIVDAIKPGQEMLPNVHRVFSLFKRLILGTFQGAASSKYIAYYLDEYVFRFNRRKSSNRGKLFRRLMEQAVITAPITRMDIRDGA